MTNNPVFDKAPVAGELVSGQERSTQSSNRMSSSKMLTAILLAVLATFLVALATFIVVFVGATSETPAPAPVPAPTSPPTFPPTRAPVPDITASPTASPTATQDDCLFPLGVEIRDGDDYVGVIFTGCPSIDAFNAFTSAAGRWSELILTNKVVPVDVGFDFDVSELCSFLQPFPVSGIEVLDHLVVIAETVDIDGPGGVLASAGACQVDANFVPVFGGMRFDNADLAVLEEFGVLEDVVLHEMGHVLGISRFFFRRLQQGGGLAPSFDEGLLQDSVYDENGVGTPGNKPKFLGDVTSEFYSSLTGNAEEHVPLEDGALNGTFFFNISAGQGRGSVDSHWDKEVFDNELMTYALSLADATRPLSRITVGSLADMGYDVDLAAADDYQLPADAVQREALKVNGELLTLEGDFPEGWDESEIMTVEQFKAKFNGRK